MDINGYWEEQIYWNENIFLFLSFISNVCYYRCQWWILLVETCPNSAVSQDYKLGENGTNCGEEWKNLSWVNWFFTNILSNISYHRGRFLGDIPILIIDWSPKDISLEVKTLILLQLLITQGYRHPGICLYFIL